MSEFEDFANDALENLRRERNKFMAPKVTETYIQPDEKDSDPTPPSLAYLEQCCPESANRKKEDPKDRKKKLLDDFIITIVNQYPESIRSQILEEVKKSTSAP